MRRCLLVLGLILAGCPVWAQEEFGYGGPPSDLSVYDLGAPRPAHRDPFLPMVERPAPRPTDPDSATRPPGCALYVTGIVAGSSGYQAMVASHGRTRLVQLGDTLGGYRVLSISQGQVTLLGADKTFYALRLSDPMASRQ